MPIQIINDPYRYGNPNQSQDTGLLGQLGQGIGRGLTRFAESKLQQIEQRNAYTNMANRLRGAAPELTQGEAEYLATLPTEYQVPLLQALGMNRQQQGFEQQNPQEVMQQPEMQLGPQQQAQANQMVQQQRPSFLQALGQASLSKEAGKEAAALRKEQFKENLKEQKKLKQESKAVYDDAIKSGKAAQDLQTHLDRMESLVKKGNLPNAAYHRILKKIEGIHTPVIVGGGPATIAAGLGIPVLGTVLSALQNASSGGDIEEFEKLSSDLIRGAKEIFGSRITDADLNAFLRTIPTLDQTDAGKLRVIKNMRQFNKAGLLKANAAKNIIKKNGGIIPLDLNQRIEEEVGPQLSKISEDIIKGFEDAEKKTSRFAEVANEQLLQGIPLIPGSGIGSLTRR